MTTEPDTSVIARILATGFNRHIELHGPDGDYASEAMGFAGGHGVVVHRGVSEFSVRVERLPAMTATAPKTPGQCWAALRKEIAGLRTDHNERGADLEDEGKDGATAFARADELGKVLDLMTRMEEGQ